MTDFGSIPQNLDVPPNPLHQRPVVLVVGSEWTPKEGGLSVLNQRLCWALCQEMYPVFCYAPKVEILSDVPLHGVKTIVPKQTPGLLSTDTARLMKEPILPESISPSIIIGHDYITGPHAISIRNDYFPDARVVVFMHVSSLELEFQKTHGNEERTMRAIRKHEAQKEIVRAADLVVSVGPHLQDQTSDMVRELNAQRNSKEPQKSSPIRFDPGIFLHPPPSLSGVPSQYAVYMFCRTQHPKQKGLDIAAKALGEACSNISRNVAFAVRGCAPGKSEHIAETLSEWAQNPSLKIRPFPFDPDPICLRGDLGRASLVLMPSREEGFGLVGLEAIEMGVPVLLSRNSGVALLLQQKLGEERVARFIIDSDNPHIWAQRISEALNNLDVFFDDMKRIRDDLAPLLTWKAAVNCLETAWKA